MKQVIEEYGIGIVLIIIGAAVLRGFDLLLQAM